MPKAATRQHIIEAADRLFYQQGFEHTSFADIAENVGISRGNFYHHFKSKDDILDAVIAQRLTNTRDMLDQWEAAEDGPEERIRRFIQILIVNQTKILRYGCPVGTLCGELAKLGHPAQAEARELFTLFRTWLGYQFTRLVGPDQADELAMHLLARSQGVATLANAFHDEFFVDQEVKQLCEWLSTQVAKANLEHPTVT
ncbi:TetR family transcriptional regulator [Marinimicrobium koreense]|uniref:TetR family transcriptional regulator n=1 Tax=Marinimicrobium koreense TaxID=306545 RepID=A0A3N1NP71_9GAMM|nr:TetR/AcrR family transcriptional regulator [Marinimicrobium koreense]ROQ17975.1 TetR family transcriptional regulator [Marinimicrobium koreense]